MDLSELMFFFFLIRGGVLHQGGTRVIGSCALMGLSKVMISFVFEDGVVRQRHVRCRSGAGGCRGGGGWLLSFLHRDGALVGHT